MNEEDKDENITLTAHLEGNWPQSVFMAKLARRMTSMLCKFMDTANDFVKAIEIVKLFAIPRTF